MSEGASFPSDMFGGEVGYEVHTSGVAVVTLNAPKRMNTMSGKMNMGVQVALDMAADDPAVRVVVITGAGKRAFCAGGNLDNDSGEGAATGFIGKGGVPFTTSNAVRTLRWGMSSSTSLRTMDKVTIAAVNGAAAGAGLSWACACDIRFASTNALFRAAFLTAGLSGDYGGSWLLPRIVGPAKAREMYLMNSKVRADEAKRIGLVSDVFPAELFMEKVLAAAAAIAAAPQLAVKRIKQNLNDADRVTFPEALDGEAERHARTAMHPDALEAGYAFMEKRKPNFKGVGKQEKWRLSKL